MRLREAPAEVRCKVDRVGNTREGEEAIGGDLIVSFRRLDPFVLRFAFLG